MSEKGFSTVSSTMTELEHLFEHMNAGVFKQKVEAHFNNCAAGVINVPRKAKAKITLTFNIEQVGEGDQIIISHQIEASTPTKRGKKTETDLTETPFFVGRAGKITFDQPKENDNGQYSLEAQADGILKQDRNR